MKNFIILSILILSFSSCKKEQYFEATVLEKGLCNQRLLQFDEILTDIGESSSNIYMCNELPEAIQIAGLSVRIKFRKPENNELILCPTIGIPYKQIVITNIEN